jgi:hypothetical protein
MGQRRKRGGVKKGEHLKRIAGNLSLAAIEQQLQAEGYQQAEIEVALDFVTAGRKLLAARGDSSRTDPRPS